MPRKKFIPSTIFPYNISARCINRDWFRLPISTIWQIFSDHLWSAHQAYGLNIHAFVLMSNHFHLIASTPQSNLSDAMAYTLRNVSIEITSQVGRINQTFGGPYHWTLLTSQISYCHAYKYLYRNPVEAGLCPVVEDYKYSTLAGLLGSQRLLIPVVSDELLFGKGVQTERHLKWLNTPYTSDHKSQIRKAIKKSIFAFAKTGNKKSPLETYAQL
jgi:REP element-mobilizing transposase RayT